MHESIFKKFYSEEAFYDRYVVDNTNAVDVIIPVLHTNELWKKNLISIYREIPVSRLILGDAGCIDDTIVVAMQFPRVKVIDQREIKTLGYSILNLVKQVETEFFIYLHSDVYIAEGWFDSFFKNTAKYDWFECEQRIVALIEYDNKMDMKGEKNWGYGGSQMGRKSAFDDIMGDIADDYVYRNEDIIIRTALQKRGYRWGFDENLYHYHEVMRKESPSGRSVKTVRMEVDVPLEEQIKESDMQFRGLVKYLDPTTDVLRKSVVWHLDFLIRNNCITKEEAYSWIEKLNPAWLCVFELPPFKAATRPTLREKLGGFYDRVFK